MKMKISLVVALVGVTAVGYAQQGGKAARRAAYAYLSEYKLDEKLTPKLESAKKKIDIAIKAPKSADDPKTWRYKADIYAHLAKNKKTSVEYKNAAVEAYDAAKKAVDMEKAIAEAKGKTKIASKSAYMSVFQMIINVLYRSGTTAYNEKEWNNAYNNFERLTQIPRTTAEFDKKKKLKLNSTATTTGNVIDMETNARLLGGLAAMYMDKPEHAEKMFMPAIKAKKFKESDVQFAYNKLSISYFNTGNATKAKAILKEGRSLFPTNYDLLITEIDIALKEGRLSELEKELELAVKSDPKNVELHFVMGNMYDELFRKKIDAAQTEANKTNAEAGKKFFDQAITWYKKAIALKADHFNSIYSLGVIHVNYSNFFAIKMKNADKLAARDQEKLISSYDKYVNLALEYLLEAEKVNGEDLGLIHALKEVYIRKNDEKNIAKYRKKEQELRQK